MTLGPHEMCAVPRYIVRRGQAAHLQNLVSKAFVVALMAVAAVSTAPGPNVPVMMGHEYDAAVASRKAEAIGVQEETADTGQKIAPSLTRRKCDAGVHNVAEGPTGDRPPPGSLARGLQAPRSDGFALSRRQRGRPRLTGRRSRERSPIGWSASPSPSEPRSNWATESSESLPSPQPATAVTRRPARRIVYRPLTSTASGRKAIVASQPSQKTSAATWS